MVRTSLERPPVWFRDANVALEDFALEPEPVSFDDDLEACFPPRAPVRFPLAPLAPFFEDERPAGVLVFDVFPPIEVKPFDALESDLPPFAFERPEALESALPPFTFESASRPAVFPIAFAAFFDPDPDLVRPDLERALDVLDIDALVRLDFAVFGESFDFDPFTAVPLPSPDFDVF